LSRGLRRVVVWSSLDSVLRCRVCGPCVGDVDEVVDDVVDELVASGSLMSVVAGGLVLVMVSVVVVADDVERSEKVGVTNSVGACCG
jgi:hypothetical protein